MNCLIGLLVGSLAFVVRKPLLEDADSEDYRDEKENGPRLLRPNRFIHLQDGLQGPKHVANFRILNQKCDWKEG